MGQEVLKFGTTLATRSPDVQSHACIFRRASMHKMLYALVLHQCGQSASYKTLTTADGLMSTSTITAHSACQTCS